MSDTYFVDLLEFAREHVSAMRDRHIVYSSKLEVLDQLNHPIYRHERSKNWILDGKLTEDADRLLVRLDHQICELRAAHRACGISAEDAQVDALATYKSRGQHFP
jgi:hypothetical protein